MRGETIEFSEGYKYQLKKDYTTQTKIYPLQDIVTEYIHLSRHGVLTIYKGYAWDGCSGPTYDDDTNMRAGLIHDALYQLMREGILEQKWRKAADKMLHDVMLEDHAFGFRVDYYQFAVTKTAAAFASPRSLKPNKICPKRYAKAA